MVEHPTLECNGTRLASERSKTHQQVGGRFLKDDRGATDSGTSRLKASRVVRNTRMVSAIVRLRMALNERESIPKRETGLSVVKTKHRKQ